LAQFAPDISNSVVINDPINIVSDIPQDSSAVLQNLTPAGLDEPLVLPSLFGSDAGLVCYNHLSFSSQPVRRSTRLKSKPTVDYRAAHTGRQPRKPKG
jgi:hypothetical protein